MKIPTGPSKSKEHYYLFLRKVQKLILRLSKIYIHLAKTVEKSNTINIKPVTMQQPKTATK